MLAADLKAKSGSIAFVVQREKLAPRGIAKPDMLPQGPATFRYLSTQRSMTRKLWERFAALGQPPDSRVERTSTLPTRVEAVPPEARSSPSGDETLSLGG
jgi:hypothetical protein